VFLSFGAIPLWGLSAAPAPIDSFRTYIDSGDYWYAYDILEAKKFYQKAKNWIPIGDFESEFICAFNLFYTHYDLGILDSAVINASEARTAAKKLANDSLYLEALYLLDLVYYEADDYSASLSVNKEIISEARKKGFPRNQLHAYNSMIAVGAEMIRTQMPDAPNESEIRVYIDSALQLSVDHVDSLFTFSNQALFEFEVGEEEKSLQLLKMTYESELEKGDIFQIANSCNNIGYTLFEMEEYDSSLLYLNKAWDLVKDQPYPIERGYIAESLAEVYDSLGNAEKTLFYMKEFLNVRDQTNADNLQKQLKMLDIEYDNRLLKLENAKREQQLFVRNLILGFLLLSVIVLGILFRIIYSARKRQEELLQKVRQQKQELNLLNKKKDNILSIFSHDLRSPLNSLRAAIELSDQSALGVEDYKMILENVKKQVDANYLLLENILQWTRNQLSDQQNKVQHFAIQTFYEQQREYFRDLLKDKDLRLLIKVENDCILLQHQDTLEIVIRNFIQNAIKFTPSKGEITCGCRMHSEEVELFVRDTGVGMSKEQMDRLFTDQHSSKYGTKNEKGAGVGLLICEDLVKGLGGRIEVHSEEGEGAELQIMLPKNIE
jgi:signal transduction histidine kinase